jgi:hypothetical protein
VGFSTGGTTCARLIINGGTNVRVGGATAEERNLIGSGCVPARFSPGHPLIATFVGNYVGIDRTGTFSIDNGSPYGLTTEGNGDRVMDVRIGGITPGSRNVFSGITGGDGGQLRVSGANNRVVVQGNYFGLNASGTASLPSRQGAVFMTEVRHGGGPGELVAGGPQPGAGNVISGNTQGGLVLWKLDGPWRISIHGNRIGTSADGLSAVPNQKGIDDAAAVGGIVIGGANAGEGNIISGNRQGGIDLTVVVAPDPPVRILGNLIGVGADFVTPIGNGGSGVVNTTRGGGDPHQAHIVGGIGPGEGNVIAYNGIHGVSLTHPNAYGTIRGNSIFSNGGLGISLRDESVLEPMPNNVGDTPAGGGNEGRNYPVILSATLSGGLLTVESRVDTLPWLAVTIDYYASDSADPSGSGEGQRYLGSDSFTMPAGGPHVRTTQIAVASLDTSDVVTGTLSDQRGNTSEFSAAVAIAGGDTTPPAITCSGAITIPAGPAGTAAIPSVVLSASDDVTASAAVDVSQSPAAGTLVGVGSHDVTATATDEAGNQASCVTTVTVVDATPPLDCSTAAPTVSEIWPPNHKWVDVGVVGVSGADGGAAAIVVTGILQDEPTNTTGDGNTAIDGAGIGSSTARVRAERTGSPRVPGNGRVYEILFTATSGAASCTGAVRVGVPHDQGKGAAVDDGIRYDSTVAGGERVR